MRTIRQAQRLRQRGAFAIFVAVAMAALLGAIGLAVDGGRLLADKSELQSAADACALAAVAELVCDSTDPTCLSRAAKKGVAVGNLNKRNLQSTAVAISEADVTFSTSANGVYNKSQNAARFAKCMVAPAGITPVFLVTIGISSMDAKASAVATLVGGQPLCSNAPIALCPGTYTKGQWVQSDYSNSGYSLSGSFKWALVTGKGASNIADALTAKNSTCVGQGDAVIFPGVASGVSDEYNSRFGLYKSVGTDLASPSTPAPDKTGYAYPTAAIPLAKGAQPQISAYSDYLTRRAANTAFSNTDYVDQSNKKTFSNSYKKIASSTELQSHGQDRRLVTAIVPSSCSGSATIQGSACLLMLNPMDNGAGKSSTPVYLEYLGNANTPGSPCQISGLPGDGSGIGNAVPALVK